MSKMFRMFRLRRSRAFVLFALVIVFLIYRFTNAIGGNNNTKLGGFGLSEEGDAHYDGIPLAPPKVAFPAATKKKVQQEAKKTLVVQEQPAEIGTTILSTRTSTATTTTIPPTELPDRKATPNKVVVEDEGAFDDIHPVPPPGRQEFTLEPSITQIHWEKQTEHFPIPTESIIHLPTGSPATIPKIQHKFNDETPDAKINREKRQMKVKEEFKKAWTGYRTNAWMHDELRPKSGKSRDPFCGWAATLVDSLDTLWIMGFEEEFEDAAKAVEQIDFTTSPRDDIPVFETTIRYLGGLLAAYDVSGGKYKGLLDKATELAEILLGAFDTPNRMPVLYYHWKPAFASQPHRASQRSNLAELGSLCLEFTRLAQLTKNPRYYDAVARVTNALSEFQDRGTKLGSVFPENVDASGCNKTSTRTEPISRTQNAALNPLVAGEQTEGYKPDVPHTVREPVPNKRPVKGEAGTLEMDIEPGNPSKAHIAGWDENKEEMKQKPVKRDLAQAGIVSNKTTPVGTTELVSRVPTGNNIAIQSTIDDAIGEWDCISKGLDSTNPSGFDKFSMGGGQDSTYEYFPKQYLLLGGREEKYKEMYLKTIEDVRKWMLYRPMVPSDRDILFSGAVNTGGNPETDLTLEPEVEHLTCFIGGMIGMGAKIFNLEGDLELAKKLADGCVWAYESTPLGIMPEGASVMPCESASHCAWNETAYWLFLDPMGAARDDQIIAYDANKIRIAEEVQEMKEQEEAAAAAAAVAAVNNATSPHGEENQRTLASEPKPADDPEPLQKREVIPVAAKADPEEAATEDKLGNIATGRQAEVPLLESLSQTPSPTVKSEEDTSYVDPMRPLSHKEWVQNRIKSAALPPGFVKIRARKYILRPEAIESVWYMYRITGDSTWQDKGWNMFESIINATSTKYGHSAIYDVTATDTYQTDEMESFWLAETLKYFYLLYSTPDTISLDEWVLNTEAHPFKRGS